MMMRSRVGHEVRVASSRGASEGRSTWWIATSPKLIFNDQAEEDKKVGNGDSHVAGPCW